MEEALQTAASTVDESPTSKNRLLLAEIVAESTYAGYIIDDDCFEVFLEKINKHISKQQIVQTIRINPLQRKNVNL